MALSTVLLEELVCFPAHIFPPDDDEQQGEFTKTGPSVGSICLDLTTEMSVSERNDYFDSKNMEYTFNDSFDFKRTKYNFDLAMSPCLKMTLFRQEGKDIVGRHRDMRQSAGKSFEMVQNCQRSFQTNPEKFVGRAGTESAPNDKMTARRTWYCTVLHCTAMRTSNSRLEAKGSKTHSATIKSTSINKDVP
jgi:hypothetical protein